MSDFQLLLLSGLAVLISVPWFRRRFYGSELDHIPAVGSSGIWEYCTGGLRYLIRAPDLIQEGCKQYPGRVFRVPRLFCWDFVVSGTTLIDELASAPESILSFVGGNQDNLQTDITIGREISDNPYHLDIVRSTLTRNLGKCFSDLRDEMILAFDDTLVLTGTDWKLVPALPTAMTMIARTTNRIFVGLPCCRNQEYLKLVVQFTIDVVIRAQLINLLPSVLWPIFGPFISARNQSIRKGLKHLGPSIEHRFAQESALGPDWPGKPNDFLSWLIDSAEGEERSAPALVLRILSTNMAAIHTTSMVFTHTLLDLAANPSHILPMREEAEQAVDELGWTKAALNRMYKIDSFLRESQRVHNIGPATMLRKVLDPAGFKFSDGTVIPFGSMVYAASRAEHFNPDVFDGFRFSKMRDGRGQSGAEGIFNHHMISTSVNHLAFGHGHHSCPGRFFAAAELKAMLAHLVMNYDIRAEIEGVRPPDDVFGIMVLPNRKAKVWFRRRQ
ncbi:cytochrome P450 [Mycena vulgaris]|nr:cytochrome P450 [Mycena vulgaris]